MRIQDSEKGFTLIEFVVVIAIITILASLFLNKDSNMWLYQEQAEKTAMVEVAGAIQSELTMRYGHLMINNAQSGIVGLSTSNPMSWLARPPRNYAGEFYDPTPESVASGSWVFDQKSHELVYILSRSDRFTPGPDGQKWIRYHVRLIYEHDAAVPSKAAKSLVGILFEPVVPYHWLD